LFLKYTTSVNIIYKPYATLFLVFDISKNYNEVPFLCIKFTIGFVLSASTLNENIHIQRLRRVIQTIKPKTDVLE